MAEAIATCFHCGLPAVGMPYRVEKNGQTCPFCCQGCLTAYHLIHEAGLEAFYQQRTEGTSGGQPTCIPENLAYYDDPAWQKGMVRSVDTYQEVCLILEGIHCAACIWLNEKILQGLPGVVQATVNFSSQRVRVSWRPEQVSLSTIIGTIQRIGYQAQPYDPETLETDHKRRNQHMLVRLAVSGFGAANTMMIAVALYAGYFQGMDVHLQFFFHWISLLLATPVVFYGGWPFFKGSFHGLKRLELTMDVPIALGASITYFYSVWATVTGTGGVYFDSVATFVFVLLLGRYLETSARRRTADATERLLRLEPATATLLRGGQEKIVPLHQVTTQDHVVIKPGERIPVDGRILRGVTSVDTAALTGEPVPVLKGPHDLVAAGTLNLNGGIVIQVTGIGGNTALARIIRLVEQAQSSRPPIQSLADRIAGRFIPAILLLAGVTFFYWYVRQPEVALQHAVSLLIITCPCALGLATPAAVVAAVGAAARQGFLVRSGAVLERLAAVRHLALDKTGTLTTGHPALVHLHPVNGMTENQFLATIAAVESFSDHPFARAIVAEAHNRHLDLPVCEQLQDHPGRGVTARLHGQNILVGRPDFVWQTGDLPGPTSQDRLDPTISWLLGSCDEQLLGWIGLRDPLKADAVQAVAALKQLGLNTVLLSGDRQLVVDRVAHEVGIAEAYGQLMPEEKLAALAVLRKKVGAVAMLGDGINDTPALAGADVAIVVAEAMDAAIQVADVVLINKRLFSVAQLFALSRRTMRIIRQNLVFSLLYNLLAIPLAVMGMVTPIAAAVAMPISSLVVVLNALRLRHIPKEPV